MTFENILYDVKNQIARITFNRPAVLNALNSKTLDEFGDCLNEVRRDDTVRALILTGAGEKAFVAGADINELAQRTPVDGKDFALYGQEIFHRLETLGKPSIAAINGFALGGGCELALACTIRIASRTAKLGQPEVKLGILPGYGGTQRLARLCGKGIAHEMILTGEMITADEALRIDLVNRVVESAELMSVAESIAGKIAANAPLAVNTRWKRSNAARKCRSRKACFWKRRFSAFLARQKTCGKAHVRFSRRASRNFRGAEE